ncbi:MAG: hypothetical protein NC337_02275 [Roseburia sp.]|nr:hypothetical protein [Roseburia sp.]
MRVNSSVRNLARARMIRSAKRSRGSRLYNTKALSTSSLNTTTNTRTNGTTSATKQIAMYERVEKAANALAGNVKDIMDVSGKTEISEKDKVGMISDIKSFVSNYNNAYSALGDVQGTTGLIYRTMAGKVTEAHTEELEKLGITVSKDGTLSIDKEVLEAADVEDIKRVFGAESSYAEEISGRFGVIEQYASSSISSLDKLYGTSTYNKYGSYNTYGSSADLSNYGFYNGKYYGGYSDWI